MPDMRMETPDETLAAAAAQGDRAAFSLLLTRHYDRVFRTAFRLTGRRADAEDLAQDVFIQIYCFYSFDSLRHSLIESLNDCKLVYCEI